MKVNKPFFLIFTCMRKTSILCLEVLTPMQEKEVEKRIVPSVNFKQGK